MSEQDDSKLRQAFEALADQTYEGHQIFRESDIVEVHNVSLPGQPPYRFVVTLVRDDSMVLMGVPKDVGQQKGSD